MEHDEQTRVAFVLSGGASLGAIQVGMLPSKRVLADGYRHRSACRLTPMPELSRRVVDGVTRAPG